MTNHRPDHVTAGPNDYYSEGPYWWPDRKNPNGPYIRKDGERNPGRFMGNRSDLGDMCTAVLTLGMGANLLADKRCAEHAAKVLAVWFVDPKTRMNPNLEFGQAVRGIDTGRGTGIIDTVSLIHVTQGVSLLEQEGLLDQAMAEGVRRLPEVDDHERQGSRREEGRQQPRDVVDGAGGRIRHAGSGPRRAIHGVGLLPQLPGPHRSRSGWQLPAGRGANQFAKLLDHEPGRVFGALPDRPDEWRQSVAVRAG